MTNDEKNSKGERGTRVSKSLIMFDTDHIKGYVFGTNRLKEIRGASSILDRLNRTETRKTVREKDSEAEEVFANGGAALFIIDSEKAEEAGKAVQKLYHEQTGGGTSITYAIQPIPYSGSEKLMKVKTLDGDITMNQALRLLNLRLNLTKDSLQMDKSAETDTLATARTMQALPSHPLLAPCASCGAAYAQGIWEDPDDPEQGEDRYCRVCTGKRNEDLEVKRSLREARKKSLPSGSLWGRILDKLDASYLPPHSPVPQRPKDFNVFREFTHGKEYLGLIYADANGMGNALENCTSLEEVQELADKVDEAVFAAMGVAIRQHLPLKGNTFPFDILLIGGDDIVMVTPADKAMQVAYTLAEEFHRQVKEHPLSVGVLLAPVTYPFSLQLELVEEALKAAKLAGAKLARETSSAVEQQQSLVNFVVVTGNTSLNYKNLYAEMHCKSKVQKKEFFATMRPYTLADLKWLLEQLREGNAKRLGRTRLHQLREAILKLNATGAVVDALALLRNWKKDEREFIRKMAEQFDVRETTGQKQMGTIFPWSLDGKASNHDLTIYRTPLLDFIELYDFVSS